MIRPDSLCILRLSALGDVTHVVPLVRKASLTPEIGAVLNEVSGKLDNATLIALNQQVDLQHKDPAAVADQWVNANLSQH